MTQTPVTQRGRRLRRFHRGSPFLPIAADTPPWNEWIRETAGGSRQADAQEQLDQRFPSGPGASLRRQFGRRLQVEPQVAMLFHELAAIGLTPAVCRGIMPVRHTGDWRWPSIGCPITGRSAGLPVEGDWVARAQGAAHRSNAARSPECRGGHRRPFHDYDWRGRGSNHARRGSRPGRDRRNPTTPGGGGHADESRKELEQQGKQMEAELASKLRGLCGPQRPVPCSTAPEPPCTAQPEAR